MGNVGTVETIKMLAMTSCHCCLKDDIDDLLDQAAEQTQSNSLEHVGEVALPATNNDHLIYR